MQLVYVDGAFLIHIDDRDIAVGAKPDRTFLGIALPILGWIFASHFDILIERQAALIHFTQDQRNAGFNTAETGDAVPDCWFCELPIQIRTLFVESMRRMVGRQGIDEPFAQSLPE